MNKGWIVMKSDYYSYGQGKNIIQAWRSCHHISDEVLVELLDIIRIRMQGLYSWLHGQMTQLQTHKTSKMEATSGIK
jgi:hypothetical protein